MDEILVNNFMVFNDVVTDEHYDLVIGDEAWDVDYFLHENPELKRFAFAWMTDFVGWLPMPDGGAAEARADRRLQRRDDRAAGAVPADARPVDLRRRPRRHRARHVRRRPAGDPRSGPRRTSSSPATSPGFDPAELADREALRDELGYGPDEQVCLVTVGGSGVGGDLLRRVIDARTAAAAARRRPAPGRGRPGPRIDPRSAAPAHRACRTGASCPTSTATWPPATWPSCRAA